MKKFQMTETGRGTDAVVLSDDTRIPVGIPVEVSNERFKLFDKEFPDAQYEDLPDNAEAINLLDNPNPEDNEVPDPPGGADTPTGGTP